MSNEYGLILGEMMYEDELPEDLPEDTYDLWYYLSIIPDSVGCRIGPRVYKVEDDGTI